MTIPQTFDEAFERVKQLVSTFTDNESKYLAPGYSEAQARLDFIDKFWIALGWDVNHEAQTDPYKQEVKVERGVATSEFRKRADYAFLAPNFRDVRFFVEAKKPHAGIDSPEFYFQTIRYGWNSHTPLAVLTDFEEFRVLDCRYKPNISTALGHAKFKYRYTDYGDKEKFRNIYHLFSREAVLGGSIENFAKGMPKISRKRAVRGVAPDEHQSIDESFLQELDDFREELARAYKRKNPELDGAALTEVTQRTLDRLVFMRFLEDKLIESDSLIEDLHKKGKSWENFIATSRRLDRVYNGIIFKEHSLLDSDKFNADERVFDKISQSLSHRESPYDFNAIPIHILGSIYERFLGKVIVATDKRARVEEKPEVRKAGGVYYTPVYIVRYIVDNTVGKLIEGKTPAELQEMRFADIACGSGSFLLGVYDTLLRYHTAYYNRTKRNRTEGIKAGCIQRPDGTLQLSLLQKRQILLNNIYGVDVDLQAVEVAQLSLYLKLLEDETIASAHQQQLEMKQALLPSLSKNIVCGNSLIGWDILEGKLFESGEERKLNPMNFEDAFPEVMKRGGFDAIVGNPPWGGDIDRITEYIERSYPDSTQGYRDSFKLFIDRATQLAKESGRVGLIVPSAFMFQPRYVDVRRLVRRYRIDKLWNVGDRVFGPKVVAPCCVFVVVKEGVSSDAVVDVLDTSSIRDNPQRSMIAQRPAYKRLPQSAYQDTASEAFVTFFRPLRSNEVRLDDVLDCKDCGIKHQRVGCGMEEKGKSDLAERLYYTGPKESPLDHHYLIGANLDHGGWTIDESDERFFRHSYETILRDDEIVYFSEPVFDLPMKIVWRQTSDKVRAAIVGNHWFANTLQAGVLKDSRYDYRYILGLLNSRFLNFIYIETVREGGRVFPQVKLAKVRALPFRAINFSDSTDRVRHDRMVQLVTQMLEAKQQLAAARSEGDKNFYESKCATLDRQIDSLVYELYDLTPDEIAIVEGLGQ
jgi:type I restriction-modification system DNA methylase subunit